MRFGPCNPSGTRASTRLAPSNGDRTLRLALVLALPTIALEQFLHTDRWTLAALPLYQALHWFSDSLLALPLAAAGVWAGQRIATRLGLGDSNPLDVVGRACLIALLFALLLVPGAALHEAAEGAGGLTRWQLDPTSGLLFTTARAFASVQTQQTALSGAEIRRVGFVNSLRTFAGRRVGDASFEVGMFEFQQQVLPEDFYAE